LIIVLIYNVPQVLHPKPTTPSLFVQHPRPALVPHAPPLSSSLKLDTCYIVVLYYIVVIYFIVVIYCTNCPQT